MKRTLIFAHRGAKREAAENTRTSFDRALVYPIDGIETDIQLSRDGVTVLWHDDHLAKLGLPEKRIDHYDLGQLREMNFAAHFKAATEERVMSLQEFVDDYHSRCRLLLEIKCYPGETEARQRVKVGQTLEIARAVADSRILVSSFDLESLICANQLVPNFPLVLNLEPEHQADFAWKILAEHPFLFGLCVHISTLDEAMVGVAREKEKFIAVYTCNTEEQIGRALELGVDVLISDVPQKALQMRDK